MKIVVQLIALSLLILMGLRPSMHAQDAARADRYMQQADSLRKIMKLDDAFHLYVQAEDYFKASEDWVPYLKAVSHRLRILIQQQQFEQAETLARLALAQGTTHLGETHPALATFYNLLGAIAGLQKADYPQALAHHLSALEHLQAVTEQADMVTKARTLGSIGMVHQLMGDYDQAIPFLQEEMKLIRQTKGPESLYLAFSYQDLGKIKAAQGLYEAALSYYDQNQKILELNLSPNHDFIAQSFMDIGNIYKSMGRFAEALSYFDQAKTAYLTNHGPKHRLVAVATRYMGDIQQSLGQFEAAKASYQNALEVMQKVYPETHVEIADLRHAQSLLAQKTKAYDQAIRLDQEVLKQYRKTLGESHIKTGSVYQHLGETFLEKGALPQSIDHFQKALTRQKEIFGGQHLHAAESYAGLAEAFLKSDKPGPALAAANAGIQIVDAIHETGDRSTHPVILELLQLKSQIHRALFHHTNDPADLEASFSSYQSALANLQAFLWAQDTESRKFWLDHAFPLAEEAIQTAFDRYAQTQDLQYVEAALQFSEQYKSALLKFHLQNQNARSFGGVPDSLLHQEQSLQDQINAYESKMLHLAAEVKEDSIKEKKQALWKSKCFELKRAHRKLQQRLETEYPRYYALKYAIKPVVLTELQQEAEDHHQAFIQYFFGKHQLYIWTIWGEGVHWIRLALTDRLKQNLEADQKALQDINWVQQRPKQAFEVYKRVAYELYIDLLAQPLGMLPRSLDKLCIIPDGPLALLPFETLLLDTTGEHYPDLSYLVKHYKLYYQFTLFPHRRSKSSHAIPYLGIAPSYPATLVASSDQRAVGALLYNKEEVMQGQRTFAGEVWTGAEATLSRFLSHDQHPQILHLAMHGFLDHDTPLRSRLLFTPTSDTLTHALQVKDLFRLKFDTELAILSACNTGTGQLQRGEGIMSLARGFHYAEVPSIAMSLWAINGASTTALMSLFFKNLKSGQPKATALRNAKLDYLEKADRSGSPPYYWASMVLLGADSPLADQSSGHWLVYVLIGMMLLVLFASFRRMHRRRVVQG